MRRMMLRKGINWGLFVVGLLGVWTITESWLALFWALIASVHFSEPKPQSSEYAEEERWE
jgi:hypothetical protein